MKKFAFRLGAAFLIVSQLVMVVPAALAQDAGTTAATPSADASAEKKPAEEKKPVELSSELNLFMEVLFVQLKAKAYEKVHATTTASFRKNMPLKDFTRFAVASRLTDFESKVWVDKKWDPKTGLIVLKGEFTAPDKAVHTVSFEMMKKADTYEILGTTETLSVPLLSSLFPKDDELQARVTKDLTEIAKIVKRGSFRKLYKTMSKQAQGNIKFSAFNKAMKAFKKEKKDISLPDDVKIVIAEGFPSINPESGNVSVKGEYTNAKYVVSFLLGYNYEWEWRLNTININPMTPAEAEEAKKAEAEAEADAKAKAEADAKAAADAAKATGK